MHDTAKRYLDAGLCVLPAFAKQKYPALSTWKEYQGRLPTEDEIDAWFANGHQGVCLLTGAPSGNLELLDFDFGGEAFQPWENKVKASAPGLLDRLVVETSQSGGWHVVYRCETQIGGSIKLARRRQDVSPEEIFVEKGKEFVRLHGKKYLVQVDTFGAKFVIVTLIETRGDKGLFLCSPTPGYELVQGDLVALPVLTETERTALLQAARELNEYSPKPAPAVPTLATGGPVASGHTSTGNVENRAIAYLRECPPAISGQRGHDQTFPVTQSLVNGFCLQPDTALRLLREHYNPKCEPPWSEKELQHKVDQAIERPSNKPTGWLLNQQPTTETYPDVDLSQFPMSQPPDKPDTTAPADPGPIPDDLMRVPGFVGEIMDFCLQSARYPSVPLAFCGAMALQSFLCSRKVREEGGLRPNLYMLALASSGTGKAYPRKINSHILGKIGFAGAVGNQIASGQGLEDEMFVHRKMLYQTDEVDNMLRSLSSSKEAYHSMLLAMLLQLYTEADETHSMRTKAKGKGQAEIRGEIDQPGLVIFGTATPECFFEAMSPKLLTNGLFSRSIVVDVGKRGRKQRPHDVGQLPRHLIEIAKWWKAYNPAPIHPSTGQKPDLDDEHPTPAIVPYTDEGYAVLDELGTQADDEYDLAISKGDRVRAILWTRVCENATRLALVYACSRDHESPCIDREVAEWASRFTQRLAQRMLFMASSHVADNPFHAECLKVTEKLRSEPDRQLSHSVLLKRMKVNSRDFGGIIETLIQQGDIVRDIVSTKGRTQVVYRLHGEGERR